MSNSVSNDWDSSTVITPSEVTIPIASEIIEPISSSPPALTVATFWISEPLILMLLDFNFFKTKSSPVSIPFFSSIGLAPAAIFFRPSWTILWVKIVAVVVPSPALSLVFDATCSINFAPKLDIGFSRLISLATVDPSLMMSGEPNFLSITTFFAFGPIVTLTAFATVFTPFSRASRDSFEKLNCLAMFIEFFCILILISHEIIFK